MTMQTVGTAAALCVLASFCMQSMTPDEVGANRSYPHAAACRGSPADAESVSP